MNSKTLLSIICLIVVGFLSLGNGTSDSVVEEFKVNGNSLFPIIQDKENIIIDKGYYNVHPINRNNIVLVQFSWRENPLLKIVKAIPSDTIELRESTNGFNVIVNNKVLKTSEGASYVFDGGSADMISLYIQDYNGIIPENAYLVLGNRASGTLDSTKFGLIDKSNIIGKLIR
jgi:signal peptidase I